MRLGAPASPAGRAGSGVAGDTVGEPWPPPVPTGSRPRSLRLGSRRCMPRPYAWTSFRDPPCHLRHSPQAEPRSRVARVSALGLHVSLGHRPRSCPGRWMLYPHHSMVEQRQRWASAYSAAVRVWKARRDRRTESYAVQGVLAETDWITVCGELYTEATYWFRLGLSLSNCPFNTMTACCPFLLERFLPTFALSLAKGLALIAPSTLTRPAVP